mgnify:CR=1 FL=1
MSGRGLGSFWAALGALLGASGHSWIVLVPFWMSFGSPWTALGGPWEVSLAALRRCWAALGCFLVTRDLPDASRTSSRRLWGGSWGRFWLILVHLGGVLGAQDGPKLLPRRPKMPLRCLQDSPRSDFQQKSEEK